MNRHTDGPWRVDETLGRSLRIIANFEDGDCDVVAEDIGSNLIPEHAANARLIAEAPEMLKGLRAVLDYPEFARINPGLIAQIRCMVEHIEGGEPR